MPIHSLIPHKINQTLKLHWDDTSILTQDEDSSQFSKTLWKQVARALMWNIAEFIFYFNEQQATQQKPFNVPIKYLVV